MSMRDAASNGFYQELSIADCFALYNDYFAPQGNAVILVQNQSVQSPANDSVLIHVGTVPRLDNWAKNMWAIANGTGTFRSFGPPDPVTTWFLGPPRYQIARCLVEAPSQENNRCRFEYSPIILVTVCVLNFFKAGLLADTWIQHRKAELGHGGSDDGATTLFRTGGLGPGGRNYHQLEHLRSEPYQRQPRRWMHSVSLGRRIFTYFLYLTVLAVAFTLLVISFTSLRHRSIRISIPSFWDLGFGALTPFTYLVIGLPRGDPEGLIANVLLANLPQLLLSLTYVCYNATLSAFLVQREFGLMHREDRRRTLRVSEPVGIQRSSYTISLPLRYGVPLYAASGLIHWLISQSLFLARITALQDQHGTVDVKNSFSTCGYSPIAVLATVAAGLIQVLALVLLGFRKYDGVMRIVSTNSRAISAACHALKEDMKEGYLLPLRWGVVEVKEDGIGHCTFTTAPQVGPRVEPRTGVREPTPGRSYQ
ncbi:hypothetical protein PG993_004141 [Apiospora rasikravindrae]|uniref:Uncharacterized protein n=1 Tax=Apiospora rasikravindrae TaxID=990691 RepID=A0ABR1TBX0_9PEZI